MSTILAIETSVPDASIVVWRDGVVASEHRFAVGRSHNAMVFDALADALVSVEAGEIDLVIVGTGPGNYSGTRVGIAAGQGVAIAHACPAVGLGSFAATSVARGEVPAVAIGDARRGVYFISRIEENGEAAAVELMQGDEFRDRLVQLENEALFTFDAPESLGLSDGLAGRLVQERPEARMLVDVWGGLDAGRQEELMRTPLSPTYLRAPFTSKAKSGHPLLR